MRVLVVDDEIRLTENIRSVLLEGPGYAVDVVHDGREALNQCAAAEYDLIVLDLMLPNLNGEDVVLRLRSAKNGTPVLMLTATNQTDRIVELLDAGADDYMTKPFDLGELVARCRALIRRGKSKGDATLRVGSLEFNTGELSVRRNGRQVDLSPTELRILEYLMYRPRVVVSRRELLEHLYDFTWERHSNVIEAHISNLRKKLRADEELDVLQTLRGRGYRLTLS